MHVSWQTVLMAGYLLRHFPYCHAAFLGSAPTVKLYAVWLLTPVRFSRASRIVEVTVSFALWYR